MQLENLKIIPIRNIIVVTGDWRIILQSEQFATDRGLQKKKSVWVKLFHVFAYNNACFSTGSGQLSCIRLKSGHACAYIF